MWKIIYENMDWVVEYDAEKEKYRVSYFTGYHWVDEVIFKKAEDENEKVD